MRNNNNKKYGCFGALVDIILVFCTGGLWLIWLFIKYVRTH